MGEKSDKLKDVLRKHLGHDAGMEIFDAWTDLINSAIGAALGITPGGDDVVKQADIDVANI